MLLLRLTSIFSVLTTLVAAQSTSNSSIDPNSVSPTLRAQWCQGQTNTCGTLCSGDVKDNECDPDKLAYTCTCASNNSSPGLMYYKETMPTFICESIFDNCIKAGENSQAAQMLCTENEKKNCGHLAPEDFVKAAPANSSPSPSVTPSISGTSSSVPSSSTSVGAATAVSPGHFKTGALAVGILAALALIP